MLAMLKQQQQLRCRRMAMQLICDETGTLRRTRVELKGWLERAEAGIVLGEHVRADMEVRNLSSHAIAL